MITTFDKKCFDLAEAFLQDYEIVSKDAPEIETSELASEIQSAIEDWLAEAELDGKIRQS